MGVMSGFRPSAFASLAAFLLDIANTPRCDAVGRVKRLAGLGKSKNAFSRTCLGWWWCPASISRFSKVGESESIPLAGSNPAFCVLERAVVDVDEWSPSMDGDGGRWGYTLNAFASAVRGGLEVPVG